MKRALLLAALLLVFAVFLAFLAVVLLFSWDGPPAAAGVLGWRFSGSLPEEAPGAEISLLGYRAQLTMAEAYAALRAARADARIDTVAVTIDDPDIGLAKAEEIWRLLAALRAAGKDVPCYLETAGEGSNGTLAYFLATACTTITLAPAGELNLLGLYSEGVFFRSTLDKLQIQPNFSAAGAYKSAIEVYTRSDHSAQAEEAIDAILDHDYELIVSTIAARRGLDPAAVRKLIDRAPLSAQEGLDAGLIDAIQYQDEYRARVRGDRPASDEVELATYARQSSGTGGTVAVVFARGGIGRGESGRGGFSGEATLGSDDFAETLRRVGDDDSIDAVVLRVDSPGGSALASDLILREVDLLAKRKPLVASLSDVAASGGYYIVAHAPTIVAESSTITGSIGVFFGKLVTSGLERNLLGVTRDPLKRGANSDLYSSSIPFSPEQVRSIQAIVDRTYETFLTHVGAGRKLTREQTHAVAQGRVWTGKAALDHHLIDHLGGLDKAIALAATAAHLPDPNYPRLRFYPEPPSLLDLLLDQQQPLFGLHLPSLRDFVDEHPPQLLELPPDLARLSRPFS